MIVKINVTYSQPHIKIKMYFHLLNNHNSIIDIMTHNNINKINYKSNNLELEEWILLLYI